LNSERYWPPEGLSWEDMGGFLMPRPPMEAIRWAESGEKSLEEERSMFLFASSEDFNSKKQNLT